MFAKARVLTCGDFNKLLLGFLVAGILVGMVLFGEELVLLLDFLCRGTAGETEDLVVVCTGSDQRYEESDEQTQYEECPHGMM